MFSLKLYTKCIFALSPSVCLFFWNSLFLKETNKNWSRGRNFFLPTGGPISTTPLWFPSVAGHGLPGGPGWPRLAPYLTSPVGFILLSCCKHFALLSFSKWKHCKNNGCHKYCIKHFLKGYSSQLWGRCPLIIVQQWGRMPFLPVHPCIAYSPCWRCLGSTTWYREVSP